MRRLGLLLTLIAVMVIAYFMSGGKGCRKGGGGGGFTCNPKEVNMTRDSTYGWHVPLNQKLLHLSLSAHEVAFWTFDRDSTIDSVTAVFSGPTPFSESRFEFSDSAAVSGRPGVSAGATIYNYTITVYPHGHASVTADPGIIIDM